MQFFFNEYQLGKGMTYTLNNKLYELSKSEMTYLQGVLFKKWLLTTFMGYL